MKNNKIMRILFDRFKRVLSTISPTLCSKVLYRLIFHKKLNLKNPKTFNEKLMWLKLNTYYKNDLVTTCADKYLVRDYVKKNGCHEILNDLYFVYDGVEEIIWKDLPNKFVLKINNGCGTNIICTNKDKLNETEVRKKLSKWLKKDFWKSNAEVNYKYINKKIICEKYLETNQGTLPNDYKIYCFNGVAKAILVCTERAEGLKLSFFDLKWNTLDIGASPNQLNIKKPNNLDQMIKYAEKLSSAFPFVRVDFYDIKGKVIFGEMTFSPAGCLAQYYNEYGQKLLGSWLDISKELKNKGR